jgi:hypothetical protein
MIKARGQRGGRDMILLGLTHENVARLFADEPIVVRTALPGPEGVDLPDGPDIVLVAGSDENAIVEALRAGGLTAEVTYDERMPP